MMDNIIGGNIKMLRKKNGLLQKDLADHITRQALSNYEVGRRIPDIFELMRIADIFKVTLDEITGREDIPFKSE